MTAPRLGSLWRLAPEAGGYVVLVATENADDLLHALLAVDRPAGPEDVVVTPSSVAWSGVPAALSAIACRQQTVVARDWLTEELGMLGQDECDAVGWLTAPPPARDGVLPPDPGLVGPAYRGLDDARLAAVREEATIARDLLETAHGDRAAARSARLAVVGAIGERLLEAARDLIAGVTDVIGAPIQPRTVLRGGPELDPDMRGGPGSRPDMHGGDDEDPGQRAATLGIPRPGRELLGERVRSLVVLEDRRVSVRLTGITRLAPGDAVVVMALTPTGLLSEARATVEEGLSELSFEIEWPHPDRPTELALALVRA